MLALEIGPGRHPVNQDWDIIDMVKRPYVNIVHDARILPLPLKSKRYDLVYMSHILEHIPWFDTAAFLKEIHRILKPGGEVEIWVPDFQYLVDCYKRDRIGDKWLKFNPKRDPMMWLNGRIFTYGPGEENWHHAVFDARYLRRCLKQAGFRHTTRLKRPRGIDHGPINLGIAGVK